MLDYTLVGIITPFLLVINITCLVMILMVVFMTYFVVKKISGTIDKFIDFYEKNSSCCNSKE